MAGYPRRSRAHAPLPRQHTAIPGRIPRPVQDLARRKWRTFVLYGFGFKSELNCRLCPKTTAILEAVPALRTAFFSILGPGKHVPRHKGVTKGMLRCHLGLIVPQRREDCWMEMSGVRCVWEEGRAFVFDDVYPHEVWNNTDQERVVLLIDVERPMMFGAKSLNRAILWGFKRTSYIVEARRSVAEWEARLRARLAAEASG